MESEFLTSLSSVTRRSYIRPEVRYVYTFDLTLVGSTNPVIKRAFDVPSRYTFEMLHYTIQYGIGPWNCAHLHTFSFEKPRSGASAQAREHVLEIMLKGWHERSVPVELEEGLKLSDAFEPEGRLGINRARKQMFAHWWGESFNKCDG